MGQYFRFLNLDKRQRTSDSGAKFGEIFPEYGEGDSPTNVIKLLAVPEVGYDNSKDRKSREARYRAFDVEEREEPVSWAGDRIICLGDYAKDWPDSVLAAADCKTLESPQFLYRNGPVINRWNGIEIPTPKYSGTGVLRNLSKKIYVRSEGIPSLAHDYTLRYIKNASVTQSPGLGHILMSRIGWSADTSASMCWDDADTLTQGQWAGDRFDVRFFKDVKTELDSDGWIDVTEREAERFIRIWEAEGIQG